LIENQSITNAEILEKLKAAGFSDVKLSTPQHMPNGYDGDSEHGHRNGPLHALDLRRSGRGKGGWLEMGQPPLRLCG
jgi:hypothetical protein